MGDIVRNSPTYRRNVEHLGYYWALNDYMDFATWLDWRSSAIWFQGWRVPIQSMKGRSPVVAPRTWLAAIGWRRLGLLHPDDRPAPARHP